MTDFRLVTPVALICFNRPLETARVMDTLRQVRPPRLFVIADAARPQVDGEAERCAKVREIASAVDWPCEVVKDFAESNMGCRDRVISGLNRAFANEDSLIIIEDDCLAHTDFFRFCQELLMQYRNERKVFAISGDNFQPAGFSMRDSYYFSRIFHCWGWASWRDRWQGVDFSMSAWPRLRDGNWLLQTLRSRTAVNYFRHAFDQTYHSQNSSWAYRASFACLAGGLLNIHPRVNMVSNIGVGGDATHTKNDTGFEGRAARGLDFPLLHPGILGSNEPADRRTIELMGGSRRHRVKIRLERLMRSFFPIRNQR